MLMLVLIAMVLVLMVVLIAGLMLRLMLVLVLSVTVVLMLELVVMLLFVLMVVMVIGGASRGVDGACRDADGGTGGGEFRLHGAEGRAVARSVRVRVRATLGGAAEGRQAHHQRPGRDRPKPGKGRMMIFEILNGYRLTQDSYFPSVMKSRENEHYP